MRETRPEELSSRTSPTGFTHPSIRRVRLTFTQCAQWTGKWHIKRPQERPLTWTQGHLWCKEKKYYWRDISHTRKDALNTPGRLRTGRRFLKLWHHLTCLDVATEIAHRYFLQMQEQKKLQWSEPGGTNDTHLSLRHFTRELFSTKLGKNKVKPEGPREANLNYLEIQDQYLSTFDNMLIICTPQNSMPPTAIGQKGENPLLCWLPIGSSRLYVNKRVADIGRDLSEGVCDWLRALCAQIPPDGDGREGKWRQANESGADSRRIWVM